MNRVLTLLVCGFLGLTSVVIAAPVPSQTTLDEDLFRNFMTNSVMYFTRHSLPPDQKVR